MFGGGVRAFRDGGHSAANEARGAGHGANHRNLAAERLLDQAIRNRSCNGNDQLVRREMSAKLRSHIFNNLRLDANENNVGAFGGLYVVGADRDAKLAAESLGAFFMGHSRSSVLGREQAILQQSLKENSSHFAGTE